MKRFLMLLALAGCDGMVSDLTLVDEARVLAVVADPPVAIPNSLVTIRATLVHPQGEPKWLGWTCLPTGRTTCAEEQLSAELGTTWPVEVGEGEQGALTSEVRFSVFVPPLPDEVLEGFSELDVEPVSLVRVLLCDDIDCPAITAAEQGVVSERSLAQPETLIDRLPFERVSLVEKSIPFGEDASVSNPRIELDVPRTIKAGESVDVTVRTFDADGDAALMYPYASAGGWTPRERYGRSGGIQLTYVAPEEPGPVTWWIVAQEEEGPGTAVITQEVIVE